MINYTPARNMYPSAQGESLGQRATAADLTGPTPGAIEAQAGSPALEEALAIGGQANPLFGLLLFVGIVIATRWLVDKMGDAAPAGTLRGSAINVLSVSAIAIAGIPVWKYFFTVIKVPGASTWVHSV